MRNPFSARRNERNYAPRIEGLETRMALSTTAAVAPVSLAAVRTSDSQAVTFEYDVNTPNLGPSLTFGVFRSADATFDAGDRLVATKAIAASAVGQTTLD